MRLLFCCQGLHDKAIASLSLCSSRRGPIPVELTDSASRLVNIRMFRNPSPFLRHGRFFTFWVSCHHAERLKAKASDGTSQLGVLIDSIIGLLEGLEKVEWRCSQKFPLLLRKGVEGLASEVSDIEVGDFGVLAMNISVRVLQWSSRKAKASQ